MHLIQDFRYRPEIDGLRALAVVSVVLFHAGFGCSGGYVGVDVFFVISGFLITSLIWKDLESGKFTFTSFWERRARRILPAATVVTLATLVTGWFLLMPAEYEKLGTAAKSQALFVANQHFMSTLGYFSSAAEEMPLLHMWSLSIEEQFYFVVPFVLFGLFQFPAMRSRRVVLVILGLAFAYSLHTCMESMARHPKTTFYSMPCRSWELLLGSLTAFLPALPSILQRRLVREFMAVGGLALIVTPIWCYDAGTRFPGLAALPPCLGAALFIWANSGSTASVPTTAGRLFALRPVVFVEAISYSLYLWHWPLLAFARYESIGVLSALERSAVVCAGFILAVFSWRFVETPFRNHSWGTSTKSMFAFAGTGIAAILVCGAVCQNMDGFPDRLSAEQQRLANAAVDLSFRNELTAKDIQQGRLVPLGVPNAQSPPTVLVWGDSHAMAALPAIDQLLKERGMSGVAATHSAMPPILGWSEFAGKSLYSRTVSFNEEVFNFIQEKQIRDVILIGRWCGYADKKTRYAGRNEALLKAVKKLVASGVRPTVLLNVPTQPFDPPKFLAKNHQSKDYVESCCAKSTGRYPGDLDDRTIEALRSAGATVLDPKPLFLDSTGEFYIVQDNETVLYRDSHHLSTKGALHVLLPFFRDELRLDIAVAQLPDSTRTR